MALIDFSERVSFVSPGGRELRLCGLGDFRGTYKFLEEGREARDLDEATIYRCLSRGWRWIPDRVKSVMNKITVSRWPDGTHWYVWLDGKGVLIGGVPKWRTEKAAWDAVERWLLKEC